MTHGTLNLKIKKSFSKKKIPPAEKKIRYAKLDIFLALLVYKKAVRGGSKDPKRRYIIFE